MPVSKATQAARRAAGVTADAGSCKTCSLVKPASEFRMNWRRASGLEDRCRTCVSDENRSRRFGLTPGQYAEMLAAQEGVCAICGQAEWTIGRDGERLKCLAVDHDHESGRVRGLLCAQCNKGLGNLGDDPDRLMAAVSYLLQHSDVIGEVR